MWKATIVEEKGLEVSEKTDQMKPGSTYTAQGGCGGRKLQNMPANLPGRKEKKHSRHGTCALGRQKFKKGGGRSHALNGKTAPRGGKSGVIWLSPLKY